MKTTRRDFLCLSAMACAWLLTGCQNPTVEERAVSWQQQEVSDPVSETGPMWNAALDDNAVLRDGIRVPQNFELPLEGSTGFAGAAVMLLYAECMVTPVISGPVVAREVATATFTRRGKVAMACFALPVNTVVFSVSVSRCSAHTGVLRKPFAPVWVSMPAVSGRPCACAIRVTVCSTSKPPIAPLARCTFAPPSTAAALTCA